MDHSEQLQQDIKNYIDFLTTRLEKRGIIVESLYINWQRPTVDIIKMESTTIKFYDFLLKPFKKRSKLNIESSVIGTKSNKISTDETSTDKTSIKNLT